MRHAGLASAPLKAMYSIAELARAAGMRTYTMRRLLRRSRVALVRVGRQLFVSLPEIRRKIPPLWEGIVEAERVRRDLAPRVRALEKRRRRKTQALRRSSCGPRVAGTAR